MRNYDLEVPVSKNNDSIWKEDNKCITCGYCKKVCRDDITVARMFEVNPDREPICINCGQCANVCPTEAIRERFDYLKVKSILDNKNGKKVVISVSPAVRVAIGEEFGLEPGCNLEGKIASAIKVLGADYAFDITFGADLTIMEEAMELVNRIKNNGVLPQFTSCCPAWVKYCEIFYPELIPNLSTSKSPISMQSTLIKTYFKDKVGINEEDIVNIVVAPCTAKKYEINRKELSVTDKDTDYLLTTREFALLLREYNIDICTLDDGIFDSPLGTGTGAGVIFGNTGGVMEAALRTAYYFLTDKDLDKDKLVFLDVRGMNGIKEASIDINGKVIKVAVCNGMKYAKELIDKLLNKEVYYDFIEVMNCIGGCIAGGGQPKSTLLNLNDTKKKRINGLYEEDENMTLRYSYVNPEIVSIYNDFLNVPNSELAHKLLHTYYEDKSYLLRGDSNE